MTTTTNPTSPSKNHALIRTSTGTATLLSLPIPPLKPGYLLIRTTAIALNPTDHTTLDAKGAPGTIVGCDYAGTVVAAHPSVSKQWTPGDRIAGFSHGGNDADPRDGAFARYVLVKGDVQMRVPEGVRDEEACAVGVGVATVGFALFDVLGLGWPGEGKDKEKGKEGEGGEEKWVLVYGGSTATGSVAVQFAKLAGLKVITTCSPRNFGLVKSRGADIVLDYHDHDVGAKIRAATSNALSSIFDTVSLEQSRDICDEAMGAAGGIYCNLLGIDSKREDVRSEFFLGYQISGEDYMFEGDAYAGQPDKFEFGKRWMAVAEKLWAEGKWKNHPISVREGGLLGAIEGMQCMREGKYSGEKLVYRVDDTAWPET